MLRSGRPLIVACLFVAVVACRKKEAPTPTATAANAHDDFSKLTFNYCANPATPNILCSMMPGDINKGALNPGYEGGMTLTTQLPFDVVSWQSFVALNWPSDS